MADPPTAAGVRPTRRHLRGFLWAALPAAGIVGFLCLSNQVLMPLHRQGVAQSPLALLNGLSRLLEIPGNFVLWGVVGRMPFARSVFRWPSGLFLGVSFLFYAAGFALIRGVDGALKRWAARVPEERPGEMAPAATLPDPATSAPRPSRRRVLLAARTLAVGGVAVAGGYPLFVETRRLAVTRRRFPVRGLPAALDGLRVVQLTDIHLGPWNSLAFVRRIVDAANELEPDLVALTGDYVLHSAEYVAPVAAELGRLRAKAGVVGVLGNHDWWEDGPLSQRELTRAGVRLVDNGRVFVTPSRAITDSPAEGLCVAGVGDLMTDKQLYGSALGDLPPDMPRLLLSHNPDVAEERALVASGHRVDLMLSGHTHGGQIRLPVVGAPVTMSRYGQKYARGLVQGPVCPVYISRGLGTAMLPIRFGSVPEIAVIELKRV